MTLYEKAREYRLPNPTCLEDLQTRWSTVLTYGEQVLVAGHLYQGPGQPSYFAAVYEFLFDEMGCEDPIGLCAISDEFFEDDGHAIAWALAQPGGPQEEE